MQGQVRAAAWACSNTKRGGNNESPLYKERGLAGENPLYNARGPRQTTSLDGSYARGPRQTTSLDGSFARGPRQTTSLDGSINPETGGLVVDSVSRTKGFGFIKEENGSERTYNSALASTPGVMGYGWSFPYAMSLRIYRGVATITQENGSKVVFKRATGTGTSSGTGTQFNGPPRVIASFEQTSGGSYTLTRGSSRRTCPSYLLQSCESFTFTDGKLTGERTVNGSVIITRKAGRPSFARATDSGDSLTFGYTAGHITSISGSGGVSEHFTYDSNGNLSSATDPNGNTTQYGYDKLHRLTRVRDALGRTTQYRYNAAGRVTAVTDPLGHDTTYRYSGFAHTTTITSPEGRRVVLSFKSGELVDVAAGPGAPPLAEWTYEYAPGTLAVTKTVDPNLGVTTAASDADGMPLALTDALGKTTTFTYSDTGRRSSVTDPMGVKTKFTYDENGNVLTRTTPSTSFGTKQLQIYAWGYDDPAHPGDMTSSIDPLGNETDYTYDSRGNPTSVTDPLGKTWKFEKAWPCRWELSGDSVTDPLGHTTTTTCDKNGNVLTTTDGTGATTTYTYDGDNELTSSTDPAGRGKKFFYTGTGRLSAVRMPDGTISRATYGADGEMTSMIDPAGGVQGFTYDGLGRMVSSVDQLGRATTFGYDPVGNLTSSTDAMGVTTMHTYDADNQLLSTSFSDPATPPVSYAYDADGRRISMTDGTGTKTYEYDSLGRVTLVIDESGSIVDPEYDLAGNRTSLQYPNGHTVTMQYDGNGQMTGVTDWLGNTSQFQYDSAGWPVKWSLSRPDSTAGKTTTWAYDAANRKVHAVHHGADGSPYASFDYTRAVDGRITAVHTTGLGQADQSYGYDAKGRLGAENANLLSFDSRDNLTHLPNGSDLHYDAADQLTSMLGGGVLSTFTYDANGRRTGSSSAASALSYGWNASGDMTSFSDNGTTTSYAVNGDDQRMSSSGAGVAHSFAWDTAASRSKGIIVKTPGGGMPGIVATDGNQTGWSNGPSRALLSDGTNSYIYGPDGLPIEQIDNAGNVLFLDHDAQGSVRLLTDAAGDVKGAASYDAFGSQTAQSGETSPFGFDGMYLDAESGLYAMSGGVYDPATGQSVRSSGNPAVLSVELFFDTYESAKPVCDVGWYCPHSDGLSPYVAGGGDPVNHVDPPMPPIGPRPLKPVGPMPV